ncbi:MAG: hypothetical protein U0R69_11680 [Gaiellales bacterium]
MASNLDPIPGCDHHSVGGLEVDVVRVGAGRMKRIVYPPGFRWSTHMQPVVKTDHCLHTHVGFLVQGHMQGVYEDGCTYEFVAPQFAVIEAGHDGWVVGDEPAVFIQYDFEEGTARRFGVAERHGHG